MKGVRVPLSVNLFGLSNSNRTWDSWALGSRNQNKKTCHRKGPMRESGCMKSAINNGYVGQQIKSGTVVLKERPSNTLVSSWKQKVVGTLKMDFVSDLRPIGAVMERFGYFQLLMLPILR